MPKSKILLEVECPVCGKYLCAPVAEFPYNDFRAPSFSTLYGCFDCGSAHFQHLPREGSNLQWHLKVFERNMDWSEKLYAKISKYHTIRSVIDIGCGIGTWLNYLSLRDVDCLGFDTQEAIIEFGKERFGLDLRCDFFSSINAVAVGANADLLSLIMVMEHLSKPRDLGLELAKYCKSHNAKLFVSVPFFNNKTHLNYDSNSQVYNVFNDVGAHVTYFSDRGLITMFRELGMQHVAKIENLGWRGFLFKPR